MTAARRRNTPFLGPMPRAVAAPDEPAEPARTRPVRLRQTVLSALLAAAALLAVATPAPSPLTFHDPPQAAQLLR